MSAEERLNTALEYLQTLSPDDYFHMFTKAMLLGLKTGIEDGLKELRHTKEENERLKAEIQQLNQKLKHLDGNVSNQYFVRI